MSACCAVQPDLYFSCWVGALAIAVLFLFLLLNYLKTFYRELLRFVSCVAQPTAWPSRWDKMILIFVSYLTFRSSQGAYKKKKRLSSVSAYCTVAGPAAPRPLDWSACRCWTMALFLSTLGSPWEELFSANMITLSCRTGGCFSGKASQFCRAAFMGGNKAYFLVCLSSCCSSLCVPSSGRSASGWADQLPAALCTD